ncbi:hypothetical protein EDD18DRAFT_1435975 [Armillaria luteobubalina]|uniref:Uncharacterized protein n=1 Tax=Armillaria luteobubalina TaxID=153913 RepID=A0AA39PCY9_9AGAR|nr:hypothetical protein EDD18DRAFT_1435975 [Armillaria luteobubalina]
MAMVGTSQGSLTSRTYRLLNFSPPVSLSLLGWNTSLDPSHFGICDKGRGALSSENRYENNCPSIRGMSYLKKMVSSSARNSTGATFRRSADITLPKNGAPSHPILRRRHSRSDYPFPTTMKLPNEERTLTFLGNFLHADEVHENEDPEEFLLKPGPDFDEGERQERFRAREEEDNVKKRAHGPVPKTRMISRKRKEVSEPGTAENSLQDGSAKVLGHPAKRARNKKT